MPHFNRLQFAFLASAAGLLLLVNFPLSADSFEIIGSFSTSNQVGPDYDGTFVLAYSVAGLPAMPPAGSNIQGPALPLSNLDLNVTLDNGIVLNSALSGSIVAQNDLGTIFDYLTAVSGSGDGVRLIFASGFNGVGPLLANSNEDSSILTVVVPGVGNDDANVDAGSSFAAPEPSPVTLGALGLAALISLLRRSSSRRTAV